MNPSFELNLGLLLFLPWFLILGVLYWWFPRRPRHAMRRLFDAASLLLAAVAFVFVLHEAQAFADPMHGRMWRQILATSVGYGAFLLVLVVAALVRWRLWSRRPPQA